MNGNGKTAGKPTGNSIDRSVGYYNTYCSKQGCFNRIKTKTARYSGKDCKSVFCPHHSSLQNYVEPGCGKICRGNQTQCQVCSCYYVSDFDYGSGDFPRCPECRYHSETRQCAGCLNYGIKLSWVEGWGYVSLGKSDESPRKIWLCERCVYSMNHPHHSC